MDTLTYTLATPVQFTPTRLIEDLSFRTELTVRELRRLEGQDSNIGATVALIAILSGEPVELIDALASKDFFKIQEFLFPFLKDSLGAGTM
jgi:hypothetical protein